MINLSIKMNVEQEDDDGRVVTRSWEEFHELVPRPDSKP